MSQYVKINEGEIMATVLFTVAGPFNIPVLRNGVGARIVDGARLDDVRRAAASVGSSSGLYVFAVRAGRGFTPWYVGMAGAQSLLAEAFTPDKLNKLNTMLHTATTGTPVVFFCAASSKRTPPSKGVQGVIEELEDVLIYEARLKNPDVINRRKGHGPEWQIQGVWRGGPGKPSAAAREFSRTLW